MKQVGGSQTAAAGSRAQRDSVAQPTVAGGVGHLPVELTSFVGRRHEVTEAKRLLSTSRLVTLTGPGGVGKTRLALRVIAEVRRAFGDEVWLVELDQLQDPALVAHTVAESLRLREQPTRPPMEMLTEYLARRRALLVLDNCEHLLWACGVLADSLLRSCPQVQILATSREQLGIGGETTLAVPPLAVPDPRRPPSRHELPYFEAVTLFAERATAALPDFTLTDHNKDAVVEICLRLDGLPLAIELAAARMRALSAQEISHRLSDRYRLLTTGPRDAPTRQQTLRSCIQWSYDLCTPEEQLLWARLAVFSGSFQLNAAEGICADDDLLTEDILDLVASLVDKSILTTEKHGTFVRYRLLDTIREFGREKLHQTGEYTTLYRRHRGWYSDLVAHVTAALGVGVVAWRQGDSRRAAELLAQSLRLKREMDDLLGTASCLEALAWIATAEQDHRRAATLLGAAEALSQATGTPAASYWVLTGYHEQCDRQSRAALGEQAFQAALRHGSSLKVEDAISYALSEKIEVEATPSARAESTLTRREQQVAELAAQGLRNKDIAAQLVISQRTAEAHLEHILVKLGLNSRTQIAAWIAQRRVANRPTSG